MILCWIFYEEKIEVRSKMIYEMNYITEEIDLLRIGGGNKEDNSIVIRNALSNIIIIFFRLNSSTDNEQ